MVHQLQLCGPQAQGRLCILWRCQGVCHFPSAAAAICCALCSQSVLDTEHTSCSIHWMQQKLFADSCCCAAFPCNTFNLLQSTVYECKPNGIIKVLQAYCDPNVSFFSYTLLIKLMHDASIVWITCANHTQPDCMSRQAPV